MIDWLSVELYHGWISGHIFPHIIIANNLTNTSNILLNIPEICAVQCELRELYYYIACIVKASEFDENIAAYGQGEQA